MLISTRGRYALYVLIDLAHHENEGYVPLKEIAERQHISKKYMEGILKILVEHDLLEGVKGKGGGYRLTKPTTDYTLGELQLPKCPYRYKYPIYQAVPSVGVHVRTRRLENARHNIHFLYG